MKEKTIASWSGGKDCCYAVYRAMSSGRKIDLLMNMASSDSSRCCFHGVRSSLLELQAELMGIPLKQHSVPEDMKQYEKEFKRAVSGAGGVTHMVFGDIYLDEHKAWVERVCGDIGVTALEPLWNEDTEKLALEFIDAGFRTVIVSCQAAKLGPEFAGRVLDRDLIAEFRRRGVCPCGEHGEFHTLVVDGPVFSGRIKITETEVFLKKGFWDHWVLDINGYEVEKKMREVR